jgi:hypothetical protein
VQQIPTPSFAYPWEVRQLVTNSSGDQDPSRLQRATSGQLGGKAWLEADNFTFDQFDTVSPDLGAPRG